MQRMTLIYENLRTILFLTILPDWNIYQIFKKNE